MTESGMLLPPGCRTQMSFIQCNQHTTCSYDPYFVIIGTYIFIGCSDVCNLNGFVTIIVQRGAVLPDPVNIIT
jgi:hypothetical protein